jgi:signal transduction histidine kinase
MKLLWSQQNLTRKGLLILSIPIACCAVTIATWIVSRNNEDTAYRAIIHTQQVLQESNNLLKLLVDAETGVRGYRLTRDSTYLEPYQQAKTQLPRAYSRLYQIVVDKPSQQDRLRQINRLRQERIEILAQLVNETQLNPPARSLAVRSRALMAQGKEKMDALRATIRTFIDEEERLLAARQSRLKRVREMADVLLGMMVILSVLAYGSAFYLYYQTDIQLATQANELQTANQLLTQSNYLLQRQNTELDQFAYVVSHDLKAPLRAISNLSTWLEEDLQTHLTQDTQEQMNLLQSRVHRMEALIDGILDYSRAARITQPTEPVEVNELIAEIIDSLAPPASFVIETDLKLPPLRTHRLALQQIFANLISNAIKHHDRPDGHLWIKGRADLTTDSAHRHIEFWVTDDGPGIAPEFQERVFGIFQILAGRDQTENTGVGLAIVKKLVEAQGGMIEIRSSPGQGATFWFTWPYQ